jgi:hypothetical protein
MKVQKLLQKKQLGIKIITIGETERTFQLKRNGVVEGLKKDSNNEAVLQSWCLKV